MNIKDLLLTHYRSYPKMQIRDAVKLIYQNEFGGGHLIKNENDCFDRLKEEYLTHEGRPKAKSIPAGIIFEDIGNGLCRIHLQSLHNTGIDIGTVGKFFINTANSTCGSIEGFEIKLETLKHCCSDNTLPYPLARLEHYLRTYKDQGYPPVSHSEEYRAAYLPSYRVIKSEYVHYFELFQRIDSLMGSKDIVNVAIDGNCCSGKSTLASLLGGVYDCNLFHMDHFFLSPELRTENRLREVGGNVDYARFNQEIAEGLKSSRKFSYQKYDCSTMQLEDHIMVFPKKLNIFEGVYSMHPSLIDIYDIKVFLMINEKEQDARIKKRNEALYCRFTNEWIPKENQYFNEMKIPEKCDFIFENSNYCSLEQNPPMLR